MNDVECVVIGAGVIGLAIARALASDGREVIVLEREKHFGSHTSSRNSEVIHAGIYYEPGSLKARACVAGRDLLYRYCGARNIAHRRCGKMIVAKDEDQVAQLKSIEVRARRNGVTDLRWMDAAEAQSLEPALACVGALLSPSTGIIDSHAYMLSLMADAETHGATFAYFSAVASMRSAQERIEIALGSPPPAAMLVQTDAAPMARAEPTLRARWVVNAAGLDAHRVAASLEGFPRDLVPQIRYAKGNYFTLSGPAPFQRLIYPVPEQGGLGIHMTLDLDGRARFGPDVQWIDHIEYAVDESRAAHFYPAIRRYWPALVDGQLNPGYAGVRPKIVGLGESADFWISDPDEHGVAGLVNLFGIESPGLTASLALAESVRAIVAR